MSLEDLAGGFHTWWVDLRGIDVGTGSSKTRCPALVERTVGTWPPPGTAAQAAVPIAAAKAVIAGIAVSTARRDLKENCRNP